MAKKGHVASLTSARVKIGFMCFCFAWSQIGRVPFTPPMPNRGVEQFTFAERVGKRTRLRTTCMGYVVNIACRVL